MSKSNKQQPNQRGLHVGISLVLLLGAYLMGSWSVDTGELWQYVATFTLLVLSIRYFGEAITGKKHDKPKAKPKKA